jgi:hypothetical protein
LRIEGATQKSSETPLRNPNQAWTDFWAFMVYVWGYGNEFKLRKEKKRGKKRGDLCDLPAPESEVFSAAQRLQWAEEERNIRNQVD